MQWIHSNQPTSTGNASQYNETGKNNWKRSKMIPKLQEHTQEAQLKNETPTTFVQLYL